MTPIHTVAICKIHVISNDPRVWRVRDTGIPVYLLFFDFDGSIFRALAITSQYSWPCLPRVRPLPQPGWSLLSLSMLGMKIWGLAGWYCLWVKWWFRIRVLKDDISIHFEGWLAFLKQFAEVGWQSLTGVMETHFRLHLFRAVMELRPAWCLEVWQSPTKWALFSSSASWWIPLWSGPCWCRPCCLWVHAWIIGPPRCRNLKSLGSGNEKKVPLEDWQRMGGVIGGSRWIIFMDGSR